MSILENFNTVVLSTNLVAVVQEALRRSSGHQLRRFGDQALHYCLHFAQHYRGNFLVQNILKAPPLWSDALFAASPTTTIGEGEGGEGGEGAEGGASINGSNKWAASISDSSSRVTSGGLYSRAGTEGGLPVVQAGGGGGRPAVRGAYDKMSMRAEQTLKSAKNQAARGGVASRLDWLEDAGRRARDRHGSAVQQALLVQMRGQCTALSMHKYSSNVVEEALSLCTKAALAEAVEAETRPPSAGPAGGSVHRNDSVGRGNGESKGGQTSAADAADAAASVVASVVGHDGETYVEES